MNVKIDTKEKFTVITPNDTNFTANMTEELLELLHKHRENEVPHVVLNLKHIESLPETALAKIAELQRQFYNENKSMVLCQVPGSVVEGISNDSLQESLNMTATESEAWDILQMEEVERELLKDFNDADAEN